MPDNVPYDPVALLGVVFLTILLNGFLFGVLTQQFYSYWVGGFKDSRCIKAFVVAQYCVITLQCVMLSQVGWNVFVIGYGQSTTFELYSWQGLVGLVCQHVLILIANIFFANRIYTLTESRLQSGVIVVLSATAFVFGLCTLILSWTSQKTPFAYFDLTTAESATTVIQRTLQLVSESLISVLLIRSILNSRSGFEKLDSPVHHVIGRVVQIGLFATTWSLAGMATWFLLPKHTVYAFFDMTAGSIYTHMIFDTLLSRTRLPHHMVKGSNVEVGLPSQSRSHKSERQRESLQIPQGGVSAMAMPYLGLSTDTITKEDASDFECAPVGQAGVRYEAPYTPYGEI